MRYLRSISGLGWGIDQNSYGNSSFRYIMLTSVRLLTHPPHPELDN